jgi:hypothetical protein
VYVAVYPVFDAGGVAIVFNANVFVVNWVNLLEPATAAAELSTSPRTTICNGTTRAST